MNLFENDNIFTNLRSNGNKLVLQKPKTNSV